MVRGDHAKRDCEGGPISGPVTRTDRRNCPKTPAGISPKIDRRSEADAAAKRLASAIQWGMTHHGCLTPYYLPLSMAENIERLGQGTTYEHLFDPLVGAGEHGRPNGEEAIARVTDDGDTL